MEFWKSVLASNTFSFIFKQFWQQKLWQVNKIEIAEICYKRDL